MIDAVIVHHAVLLDENGNVVWQCDHNHMGRGIALECAAEEDARRAAADEI